MIEVPYYSSTVLFLFLYCSAAQMECAGCVRMHTQVCTHVRTVYSQVRTHMHTHITRVRTLVRTVNTHVRIVHTHLRTQSCAMRTYVLTHVPIYFFFQKRRTKIQRMLPSFDFVVQYNSCGQACICFICVTLQLCTASPSEQ